MVALVSFFSAVAVCQRYSQTGSGHASEKQGFPQRDWDVRYNSGSFKLKKGQWLKSAFVPADTASKTAPSATISVERLSTTKLHCAARSSAAFC
jgi:hypothetical protein